MKRLLLISAAAFALAVMPMLPATAMPRAAAHAVVTGSNTAVVLTHGDHSHALGHTARIDRDRSDSWSRGLRRFRSSFN